MKRLCFTLTALSMLGITNMYGAAIGTCSAGALSTFIGNSCTLGDKMFDNFTFSGSAGAMGSFSANTVTISGGAAVHYDENLGGGTDPQYVVSSWNEI